MAEYIVLAVEVCLLLVYPLQKTYSIWKSPEIDGKAYKETIAYWMIFAMFQGMSWHVHDNAFTIVRILILFAVMFKLPLVARILFRNADRLKKDKSN